MIILCSSKFLSDFQLDYFYFEFKCFLYFRYSIYSVISSMVIIAEHLVLLYWNF